jgi:glycosyltransferase involved in cell wall biosynthesis
VGRNPVFAVRELASLPGVELIGQVADVRPFLAKAMVAIAPLRIARGIQNKVLEGAAMGKPVVATSAALEGLDFVPGEHVLRADSPEDWLAAITQLFNDPAERTRIAESAKTYVEHNHSWSACLAPLDDILGTSEPCLATL